MTDTELERRIHQHRLWLEAAKTEHIKRLHLKAMTGLIARRSPEQVARMERQMGLR